MYLLFDVPQDPSLGLCIRLRAGEEEAKNKKADAKAAAAATAKAAPAKPHTGDHLFVDVFGKLSPVKLLCRGWWWSA